MRYFHLAMNTEIHYCWVRHSFLKKLFSQQMWKRICSNKQHGHLVVKLAVTLKPDFLFLCLFVYGWAWFKHTRRWISWTRNLELTIMKANPTSVEVYSDPHTQKKKESSCSITIHLRHQNLTFSSWKFLVMLSILSSFLLISLLIVLHLLPPKKCFKML